MKVAFLGIGLMGFPMAERLLEAQHKVYAYNRTKEKAEPLGAKGAVLAGTPAEAIREAQCAILMLTDAKAIEETLLKNPDISFKEKTVIQMGTITTRENIAFLRAVKERGGEYFECPVLGSIKEARSGSLILMVGATQEQFLKWKEFLTCFGPNPKLIGEVGQASAVKLAMNQFIASLVSMFSLSLGFIQRKGVKKEAFMDILRISALYAPTFDKKMPRMLERDYTHPNFPAKHMLKDVKLFLEEAQSVGLSIEQLEGVRKLYEKALKQGLSEGDYSAVFDAINPP